MNHLAKVPPLVSTNWLKSQLTSSTGTQIRLLDTSWGAPTIGRKQFIKKHIPEATFFDLNDCVRLPSKTSRHLPETDHFIEYLRNLGINNDHHIVLYDRGTMLASSRTWWTFRALGHKRVSVVNGGLAKWLVEGMPVADGAEDKNIIRDGDVTMTPRHDLIHTHGDMAESAQIINVEITNNNQEDLIKPLTVQNISGEKHASSRIQQDNTPGCINLPFTNLLKRMPEQYTLMKSKRELAHEFTRAGVDITDRRTTLCYGNSAPLTALAAAQLGKHDAKVYFPESR